MPKQEGLTLYDVLSADFAGFAEAEMHGEECTEARFTVDGQTIRGVVLGFGSSYVRDNRDRKHNNHIPGTAPNPGSSCSVCRWADIAILKGVPDFDGAPDTGELYAVVSMGKSEVPGDKQRIRATWTADPLEVFKSLWVPQRADAENKRTLRKIPMPNAVAFRYAAFADDALDEVLERYEDAVPDHKPRTDELPF